VARAAETPVQRIAAPVPEALGAFMADAHLRQDNVMPHRIPPRTHVLTRCRHGIAGALLLLTPLLAFAAVPQRFRGRIESIAGDHMVVDDRSGIRVDVQLPDRLLVLDAQPVGRGAITVGKTMAFITRLAKDGGLRAEQVVALPDAALLARDGTLAWDLQPGQDLVIGGITDIGMRGDMQRLTVATRDGTKMVLVTSTAPVAVVLKAARADLRPGDAVFFVAQVDPDGTVSADRVIVIHDGAMSAAGSNDRQ
jgi:hypothetical protein